MSARPDFGGRVGPPERLWPWLALAALAAAIAACLGLAALAAPKLDLFHAAFFNGCTNHAYQVHWQNQRRYPKDMSYDFITSTRTFVLVEVWVADWPTVRFSQIIWLNCPGANP